MSAGDQLAYERREQLSDLHIVVYGVPDQRRMILLGDALRHVLGRRAVLPMPPVSSPAGRLRFCRLRHHCSLADMRLHDLNNSEVGRSPEQMSNGPARWRSAPIAAGTAAVDITALNTGPTPKTAARGDGYLPPPWPSCWTVMPPRLPARTTLAHAPAGPGFPGAAHLAVRPGAAVE